MSESVYPSSENRVSAQDPVAQTSGGALLRMAREAQGLHIGALAVSLKVPVKKLEALEADRFDLLPDTVFVRALALSVCRVLKIDPDPILERFPHMTAPSLKSDQSGINTPFRASGDRSGLPFLKQFANPFVLAVLALLVGVVLLFLIPFGQRTGFVSDPKFGTASAVLEPPFATASMAVGESHASDAAATSIQVASVTLPNSTASLVMYPTDIVSPVPTPMPAASAVAAMVPGSGAVTGTVVFKARGSSWVEVVDASGVVQIRKTIADGDVLGASGVMPLSVVVGRADTTEVQVRGKPFDLTRIARDNVARFEVK